jgi:hypothetical protein
MALWQCIWCQAEIVGSERGVSALGWACARPIVTDGASDALCPTCQRERARELRVVLESGRAEILDGVLYLHGG